MGCQPNRSVQAATFTNQEVDQFITSEWFICICSPWRWGFVPLMKYGSMWRINREVKGFNSLNPWQTDKHKHSSSSQLLQCLSSPVSRIYLWLWPCYHFTWEVCICAWLCGGYMTVTGDLSCPPLQPAIMTLKKLQQWKLLQHIIFLRGWRKYYWIELDYIPFALFMWKECDPMTL